MAGIFNVYYFGLICHIGPGTTKKVRAAIVKDADHVPVIFYGNGTFSMLEGVDRVAFYGLQDDKVIQLKGMPDTDNLFENFVPSLKTIMGGRLKADVGSKDKAVNAILVDYPSLSPSDGTLSVFDLYSERGRYGMNGTERWNSCIARVTGLTVPLDVTAVQIETITDDVRKLIATVNPNDCILIANFSTRGQAQDFLKEWTPALARELSRSGSVEGMSMNVSPTTAPDSSHNHSSLLREPSAHVQKYGQILDNEYRVTVYDDETCGDHVSAPACTWVLETILRMVKRGILTSIHIECSNTNWP